MPNSVAVRILGLRLEGGMCAGYSRGLWGCSILATPLSLSRIPSSILGVFPPLGSLASLGGMKSLGCALLLTKGRR